MEKEERYNHMSFKAISFENLNKLIETYLKTNDKKLLSISAYPADGYHYAMIATNPVDVVIVDPLTNSYKARVVTGGQLRTTTGY